MHNIVQNEAATAPRNPHIPVPTETAITTVTTTDTDPLPEGTTTGTTICGRSATSTTATKASVPEIKEVTIAPTDPVRA